MVACVTEVGSDVPQVWNYYGYDIAAASGFAYEANAADYYPSNPEIYGGAWYEYVDRTGAYDLGESGSGRYGVDENNVEWGNRLQSCMGATQVGKVVDEDLEVYGDYDVTYGYRIYESA